MDALCARVACGAAVALIAGESLDQEATATLDDLLGRQAEWSDLPLILLTSSQEPRAHDEFGSQGLDALENVAILERPISPRTLVSAVKLALRARGRQYARRQNAREHGQTERRLHQRASELGERVDRQADTLRLLRDVATASNFAESVEEALSFALAQVCRYTGWAFGHAFLPAEEEPEILIPVNASYEQAPGRFRAFRATTFTSHIPRGVGLVGRVYASGQPGWMRGIDREIEANRADLAKDLGVSTAAAFPIMIGTEAVGVLEFFSERTIEPEPELLDAMTSVGTQLGRVIERDRMDRRVRESHRLIEKIGETSPTLIRIFDEVEQRYVYVNERMAKFFGTSADEAMRAGFKQIPAVIHPDDLARFREAKAEVRTMRRESSVGCQVRMRNVAGEWRWIRTWSTVFTRDEKGMPTQILSISIDVTDEVEIEEKLRQTERLTSIGTLAAGLSHEINNPLSSVVITAQLLRKMALGAKTDEMLDNLIQDAKRCGRIVRSVQRFARQEPSDRVLLDLNAVVRAAQELSRADLRRSGTELRLELEKELPQVLGDATELEQVVLNLITNAAHASQRGQEVVVRTAAVNGFVQITVRDEGHGMSPDVKRHVFDPFFTTRGQEGGTGLGLSIVHGIVEDHGGTIEIDSELDDGTTVTMTLPVDRAVVP
jgi:PAS domain S-box-containing protein